MKTRCYNPHRAKYERYGGRKIGVCERWLGNSGFINFLKDMGTRPSKAHSIDRIDNNKGYSPSNCRWATNIEQSRNRSTTHHITFQGETRTISEWAAATGLNYDTLKSRLNQLGWDVEKALTTPIR